jgi:hypothetical protein
MRAPAALAVALLPVAAAAETIVGADYAEPTGRYDHAILGDAVEAGALRLTFADGRARTFRLPDTLVFEDTAPRLADLDGDGGPEVVVVESHLDLGSRLAVWGAEGRLAATPFIGTRHRWLAPVGAADLDGDGRVEIAYVERPHRAKLLKLVRLEGAALLPVAEARGLTNHRIGSDMIEGGIALCPGGAVIVTADADWANVVLSRFDGASLASVPGPPYSGPGSLDPGRHCP